MEARISPMRVRALASGTAAIHVGVDYFRKPGGDVVTAALNWPGAVGPIFFSGMRPKFIDVSLTNGCLDDHLATGSMDDDTASVLVPHLFGNFDRLSLTRSAALERGVALIDDCAQAIGGLISYATSAEFKTDVMTTSGNGSKHLGAGELGILCSANSGVIEHTDLVSLSSSSRNHERVFSPLTYGYNYRPNVFSAAIARSRLPNLSDQISARISNAFGLWYEISTLPGLAPVFDQCEPGNSFCVLPLRLVPDELDLPLSATVRDRIVELLNAEGVPVDVWLRKPVWRYMAFDGCPPDSEAFPNTALLLSTMFQITQIAPPNDDQLMHLYANAFEKVWDELGKIKDWLVNTG
jgi:dTDP-4-amino-4,6-dideoxygalactose transaminase